MLQQLCITSLASHFVPLQANPARLLGRFAPMGFVLHTRILSHFAPSGFALSISVALLPRALRLHLARFTCLPFALHAYKHFLKKKSVSFHLKCSEAYKNAQKKKKKKKTLSL